MPKRQSPPSAHDVARLAGVSQAAVSRAFTPGASISAATRGKVLEAADALGYRPNLLARSLITGQSRIVGVVLGNARYPYFAAALEALSARLSRTGNHILIHTVEGGEPADRQIEELLKFRVDAILLMAAALSPKLAAHCDDAGVPVIGFHRPLRPVKGLSAITGDNLGGGALIADHLVRQGYRRLAVITGRPGSPTSRERETGFTRYLSSQGLPEPDRAVGHFERQGAAEAMRELLSKAVRPDAVFCETDDMALAAIEVARFEFGLEIGRELGVAGFDDIEQSSWPSFSLTTYSVPVEAAAELISGMLSNGDARPQSDAVVAGQLKIRRSTQRG